ncbi:FG-GAP repeat protein [Enhygromyxa salina]|uniref:FG-GAP repeat protein n=2 Tax=Enhygromyxa salina TaxID=215803 RepID=A0A2S9XUH8_9BACT|nr:FG-GAP repeat protein [Enhygromyxa salina]
MGEAGEAIEFAVEYKCVDGSTPPCSSSFDVEGRTRPVNAHLAGTVSDLDVLFNGPGPVLADWLVLNDGVALDPWNIDLDGYAVPVVGSFTSGIGDQILLYRPGVEDDPLLVLDDSGLLAIPMNHAGYAYPLAGRYRGFGGGGNDILWYDPQYVEFSVWQWIAGNPFDYIESGPADAGSLGLADDAEYVPILGDFNGDEMTDIFWYSAGVSADVMWWSVSNQDAVIFEAADVQIDGEYRPFVGDFDGNGVSDILWFASYAEAVKETSKIWYFSEDETFASVTLSTNLDYSPYVADFDGDGCSDILWYKPDNPKHESPLWRCVPNQRDFVCEPPVTTPTSAYPVGFGGAY